MEQHTQHPPSIFLFSLIALGVFLTLGFFAISAWVLYNGNTVTYDQWIIYSVSLICATVTLLAFLFALVVVCFFYSKYHSLHQENQHREALESLQLNHLQDMKQKDAEAKKNQDRLWMLSQLLEKTSLKTQTADDKTITSSTPHPEFIATIKALIEKNS